MLGTTPAAACAGIQAAVFAGMGVRAAGGAAPAAGFGPQAAAVGAEQLLVTLAGPVGPVGRGAVAADVWPVSALRACSPAKAPSSSSEACEQSTEGVEGDGALFSAKS